MSIQCGAGPWTQMTVMCLSQLEKALTSSTAVPVVSNTISVVLTTWLGIRLYELQVIS